MSHQTLLTSLLGKHFDKFLKTPRGDDPRATIKMYPNWLASNNRNVFCSSGGPQSKMKVSAHWLGGRTLSPGSLLVSDNCQPSLTFFPFQMLHSTLRFHSSHPLLHVLCVCLHLTLLSLILPFTVFRAHPKPKRITTQDS